eukprot:gene19008-22753_t
MCIVDNREVKSVNERDYIAKSLQENGVNAVVRKLELGDFVWMAVEEGTGEEWLVDFIVERKRIDDLSGSIIDGRYKEQKFRLAKCGIRHIVYLVEGDANATTQWGSVNYKLTADTLVSAMTVTSILSSHLVGRKPNIEYLYKGDEDDVIAKSLDDFNKSNVKSRSLKLCEFFAGQLMQIAGCSAEKAHAIISVYSSPRALFNAYRGQSSTARDDLLKDLRYGRQKKKLGPVVKPLQSIGIQVHDMPFPDGQSPSDAVVDNWLRILKESYRKDTKETVGVHCVAGLGRAPVLVAIALIEAGMNPLQAVEYIREKRRGSINIKQIQYLKNYKSKKKGSCLIM